MTNRNDPCPCGSGKKFKRCHGDDSMRLPDPRLAAQRVQQLTVTPMKGPKGEVYVSLAFHFVGGNPPLSGGLDLDQAKQLGELLLSVVRVAGGTASSAERTPATRSPAIDALEAAATAPSTAPCGACRRSWADHSLDEISDCLAAIARKAGVPS